ncbi:dedicator of cytokinesis 3-like isoform X1, partial [Brachionus plicatilis]
ISIPCGKKVKELKKLYLRFLVRSRSHDTKDKNKIIGISYLQITNEDGSVIKDMHCYLPINRIETEIEPIVMNGCFIPLKFQSFSINNWQNNPDKLKEFLEIKVKVVSTQLTQNVTLLNLLSFPTYENLDENHYQCLLGYLNELSSLKEEQTSEIVKFLQAILDKLIDILLDLKNKNEKINEKTIEFHRMSIQPRVFEILVFIFQIIENQSKYASFRSVIDAYLEKNFCITLVHKPILRILYQLLSATYEKYKSTRINGEFDRNSLSGNFETNEERLVDQKSFNSRSSVNSNYSEINDELTINAIKSIEYIFKFAFRSRELLSIYNKSNNINTKGETFNKDIEDIFKLMVEFTKLDPKKTSSIYESMADISPQAKITKIQSFILKNVVNLITILLISNRYSIESISKLYVGFFESRFVLQTQFLSKIIKTKLFEFSESRKILLEPMCKVIAHYLTYENDNECDKINQGIQTLGKITAELMNVLEKQKI